MDKKQAVIYIRVSSEDQVKGSGLPIQLRDCKAASSREGFTPGKVFADEGESAKTADRPQFIAMLDYIKDNRPAAVVVWKLDRLARNALDSQLFRARLKEYGTRLISATEAIPDDYSGKLFADIVSAIAEYDNSLRAERSRNGMVYRAQEGYWVWTAPLGYKNARLESGKPTLIPDENAPLVRELFDLVASGMPQIDARLEVTNKGLRSKTGKKLTKQSVSNMLINPVYAGWLTGKLAQSGKVKGQWKPIIPQNVFDRVQLRIRSGAQRKINPSDFPLRGMLVCPKCGGSVTGSYSKGQSGTEYAYYHCQCKGVRARREVVEAELQRIIDEMAVDSGIISFIDDCLNRYISSRFGKAKKDKDRKLRRMRTVEAKLDRIVELRLEGAITKDMYDKKYSQYEEDLLLARNDYNEADLSKIDILSEFNQAKAFFARPGDFWRTASSQEKQLAFPLLFCNPLEVQIDKTNPTPKLEGWICPIWWRIFDPNPTEETFEILEDWLVRYKSFREQLAA